MGVFQSIWSLDLVGVGGGVGLTGSLLQALRMANSIIENMTFMAKLLWVGGEKPPARIRNLAILLWSQTNRHQPQNRKAASMPTSSALNSALESGWPSKMLSKKRMHFILNELKPRTWFGIN